MKEIKETSDFIIVRNTTEEDLEFVINSEHEPDNAQYVGQWTKDQHISSLVQVLVL